ncbi:MAG: SIR2 family protein [Acidithiobacillus sp.]|nr:SIR2 family protein [Acidithiobacillus sp.]
MEAAELTRASARTSGKEADFFHTIESRIGGGTDPQTRYQTNAVHTSLMVLDPDIIVTTNYDKLLEQATDNGYRVHPYESETLARDIRAGNPCIIKLHGSLDNSSRIILTRSDYSRLRVEGAHVLEVLQALFLTRTAFFVGYSMGDPDVQLLLENVFGARGQVAAHFLLGEKGMPEYQREVFEYCYGTSLISFAKGDFAEMARMLELLGQAVAQERSTTASPA